jgi:hypothetical protein
MFIKVNINLQYLFVHMLVYSKQYVVQHGQFEHKSMLDLSAGEAVKWTTFNHAICVSACMRFYENTSRRLYCYYPRNNNADVQARVPTSRSCTNSGHTKE